MKILLTLFLVTICMHISAQVYMFRKDDIPYEIQRIIPYDIWDSMPDSALFMGINDAAKLEYWGQKGITSVPLIAAMEAELENSRQQEIFSEKILENCQSAKEEYRNKFINLNAVYQVKLEEFSELQVDRDMWKQKAKKRQATIFAMGGAIGVALAGILLL